MVEGKDNNFFVVWNVNIYKLKQKPKILYNIHNWLIVNYKFNVDGLDKT